MTRYEAIQEIMSGITDECVITSTGMISREVYAIKDRPRNFYMLGSMGYALAIGIGLAYTRPDLNVVVISGDGACLMSLGTLVLMQKLKLPNLTHYILDNQCHATTGGQPTCSDAIDFYDIFSNTVVYKVSGEKGEAPRIPLSCKTIKERFCASIDKQVE